MPITPIFLLFVFKIACSTPGSITPIIGISLNLFLNVFSAIAVAVLHAIIIILASF